MTKKKYDFELLLVKHCFLRYCSVATVMFVLMFVTNLMLL